TPRDTSSPTVSSGMSDSISIMFGSLLSVFVRRWGGSARPPAWRCGGLPGRVVRLSRAGRWHRVDHLAPGVLRRRPTPPHRVRPRPRRADLHPDDLSEEAPFLSPWVMSRPGSWRTMTGERRNRLPPGAGIA